MAKRSRRKPTTAPSNPNPPAEVGPATLSTPATPMLARDTVAEVIPGRQPWLVRNSLLTVLLVVGVVRLIHLGFMAANDPFFDRTAPGTDMETYWNQGRAIANGDVLLRSFSGAFYYGPLYSYFLAPWIAVFGEKIRLIHYVQFLLGLVPVWLAWLLGRRLAGDGAGLAAGLLAGLCVPAIFWSQTILVEALNLTLIAAAIVLMVLATDRERDGRVCRTAMGFWFLAGALLGLAVSGRGNTLLVLAGIVAVRAWVPLRGSDPPSGGGPLLRRFWVPRRGSTLLAALLLAGSILTLALPIARNIIVAGRVAITTNGPALLYIGNYRDSIGVLTSSPHLENLLQQYGGEPPYMRELIRDIRENPARVLWMQWVKARIFISAYDAPDNFSLDLYARFSPVLRYNPVGWATVIALAGIGAWKLRRRLALSGDLWPLTSIIILFPLSIIPVLVVGRYRLPWLFPLFVLGGVGVSALWSYWQARRWRGLLEPAIWTALVIVVTQPRWSPASQVITIGTPPRYIRPNDYLTFAKGMEDAGWPEERWMAVLESGLREHPEAPFLVYRVASLHIANKRPEAALKILETYMALQPDDPNGAKLTAQALIMAGDPDRAAFILEQVIRINPQDQEAIKLLGFAQSALRQQRPNRSGHKLPTS